MYPKQKFGLYRANNQIEFVMLRILFLLILAFNLQISSAQNSISIRKSLLLYSKTTNQPIFPSRAASYTMSILSNRESRPFQDSTGTGNRSTYIDSIRFEGTLINKAYSNYRVMIYDADSTLRSEGPFFDQYPCGLIINYDKKGDTLSYGDYKLYRHKKPKSQFKNKNSRRKTSTKWLFYFYSRKDGKWTSFDRKRKTKTVEVYDNENGVKTLKTYNSKGKIIFEDKSKLKKIRNSKFSRR
jgi:hypothetical protein